MQEQEPCAGFSTLQRHYGPAFNWCRIGQLLVEPTFGASLVSEKPVSDGSLNQLVEMGYTTTELIAATLFYMLVVS